MFPFQSSCDRDVILNILSVLTDLLSLGKEAKLWGNASGLGRPQTDQGIHTCLNSARCLQGEQNVDCTNRSAVLSLAFRKLSFSSKLKRTTQKVSIVFSLKDACEFQGIS